MAEPTVTPSPRAATFVGIVAGVLAIVTGACTATYIYAMLTLG